MTNPCKVCLVVPMCCRPCSKYTEYIGTFLTEYTYHSRIEHIADYIITVKPDRYYLRLYLKENPHSVSTYNNYVILLDGTTIIGLEPDDS